MSNWTHVAAVIRADSIKNVAKYKEHNYDDAAIFDKIIGKQLEYHGDWDDFRKNKKDYMPCGSEESLRKSVWINPDKSSADTYTISIWGDLRDNHHPQKIVDWFKKLCKKFWIRQAMITAQNEWNGTVSWVYSAREEEKEP